MGSTVLCATEEALADNKQLKKKNDENKTNHIANSSNNYNR